MKNFPGVTFDEFITHGYCYVEDPATATLGPIQLYPLQATFAREVWDTLDPVTGTRRFRRAVFSVPKKFGKSTFAAVQAIYHLLFDPFETDREVYTIAGDLDQALIVLGHAQRIIKRSPKLKRLFRSQKDLSKEIIFEDHETGQVHRFRALASDSPTAHGLNPSLVVVDEGWQFSDYSLLEAVTLGPQRRCPLQLSVTYSGLKAQMCSGNPLYDLYTAGMAGTDPTLYFTWRSGPEAYDELPPGFMRAGYLEEQRRALPLNRFERLHYNAWGSRDVGFLSDAEIARATRPNLPVLDRSTALHVLAVDYGRTHDQTALLLARKDGQAGVAVSAALTLQGTPDNPVPLEVVEDQIADLMLRFRIERILFDPWQMHGSTERLAKRLHLPILNAADAEKKRFRRAIVIQPINAPYLNRLTMALLALFRSGQIAIPAGLTDLVAQLESLLVKETFFGVKIDSGTGTGVRAHDDLAITLGMACLELGGRGSFIELPAGLSCRLGGSHATSCFVFRRDGWPTPLHGYINECRDCQGWQMIRAAHADAERREGQAIEIEEFRRTHVRIAGQGDDSFGRENFMSLEDW